MEHYCQYEGSFFAYNLACMPRLTWLFEGIPIVYLHPKLNFTMRVKFFDICFMWRNTKSADTIISIMKMPFHDHSRVKEEAIAFCAMLLRLPDCKL